MGRGRGAVRGSEGSFVVDRLSRGNENVDKLLLYISLCGLHFEKPPRMTEAFKTKDAANEMNVLLSRSKGKV